MVSEKDISILRSEILNTFSRVPWPRNQQLTSGDTDEEEQIKSDFEGLAWWNAPPEVLRHNYGSMAFFAPFAFHYFLPSYMLSSLENFESDNEILMFTVFSLAPTKTAPDDKEYSKRIQQFSLSEREIVQRFLLLIIEAPIYSLLNDAQRALRKFWGSKRL